jgi:hypothetical protein
MDRTGVSGTSDVGSIPPGSTTVFPHIIKKALFRGLFFFQVKEERD